MAQKSPYELCIEVEIVDRDGRDTAIFSCTSTSNTRTPEISSEDYEVMEIDVGYLSQKIQEVLVIK